jgi:hypothetical protein
MIKPGIQLIGIHGHAGVGKDTLALYFHEEYTNVYIEHFADPLKAACSKAFGIQLEQFSTPEVKEKIHPYWNVSPRQIAQFMGTEIFRDQIYRLVSAEPDKSFWIKRLEGTINGDLVLEDEGEYGEGHTVIIPDVRFQDEADWIVNNGGVIICLTRPNYNGVVGISNHESEKGNLLIPGGSSYEITNEASKAAMYTCAELALKEAFNINLIPKS